MVDLSEGGAAADAEAKLAEAAAPASDEQIVERVFAAVIERRLRPGAKLPEAALCDAFGVSRSSVRRILIKLAERGIVTLHPNRGAFISSPSWEEARNVFQARRTIEPSIVESAAQRITKAQLEALKAHVAREAAASVRGDKREAIRLSGEFHVKVAEVAGNPVIARFLEELVARSSLIIAMFGSRQHFTCSEEEHSELLEALKAKDGVRAARLMSDHLGHLELELDIGDQEAHSDDIRGILGASRA